MALPHIPLTSSFLEANNNEDEMEKDGNNQDGKTKRIVRKPRRQANTGNDGDEDHATSSYVRFSDYDFPGASFWFEEYDVKDGSSDASAAVVTAATTQNDKKRKEPSTPHEPDTNDRNSIIAAAAGSQDGDHGDDESAKTTNTDIVPDTNTNTLTSSSMNFRQFRRGTSRPLSSRYSGVYKRKEVDINKHPRPWNAQSPMRNGKGHFFVGKYPTEVEAAFAVDLMTVFIHGQEAKEANVKSELLATTTTAENENNFGEGKGGMMNLSTPHECEDIWKKYKHMWGCREFDFIDVKFRPPLREIVLTEVNIWMGRHADDDEAEGFARAERSGDGAIQNDGNTVDTTQVTGREGASEENDAEDTNIDLDASTTNTKASNGIDVDHQNIPTSDESYIHGDKKKQNHSSLGVDSRTYVNSI